MRRSILPPGLADAIRGDLEEERRRRAQRSPTAARVWSWRAWIGIAVFAAWSRIVDAARGWRPSTWLGPAHEWRQAMRGLRRSPWYAASGAGVIALSLTLTTTVFAVVDGVVFRPLPYVNSDDLVAVVGGFRALPTTNFVLASWPDVRAWKAAAPAVAFATLDIGGQVPVGDGDSVPVAAIDEALLNLLGVKPLMGGFAPTDYVPEVRTASIVPALLTYQTWQKRFGGDPGVIGRVRTDSSGHGLRVAGILPRSFVFPTSLGPFVPEVLTPLVPGRSQGDPSARGVRVLGRLPPGMTVDALSRRLSEAASVVAAAFPALPSDPRLSATQRILRGPFDVVHVRPLIEELTLGTRPVAVTVFVTAAGLLLLASLNLIGLSSGRFLDRHTELGLRRALGGTTPVLVRLVAIEHGLLVMAGGLVGMAALPLTLGTVGRLLPRDVVLFKAATLDLRVAAFAGIAMMAAMAVVTVGIAIAMPRRISRPAPRATESGRSAARSAVVSVQIALALVMTVSGALLAASLLRIWTAPVGWRPESLARLRVRAPDALDAGTLTRFLDQLRRTPGVAHAGALDLPILEESIYVSAFETPEGALKSEADAQSMGVTDDFFDAAGLTLVSGRLPTRREFSEGASVAVVSRRLGERYWRGQSPMGQTIRRSRDGRVFVVVGVVPDVLTVEWDLDSGGDIYVPLAATLHPNVSNILVRFERGHDAALDDVVAVAANDRSGFRLLHAETFSTALGESIDWQRFQSWLFIVLGGAALAIVGVGVLGLMAMRTGRRTREVGVRMALGATRAGVRRQLVREQFGPVAAGLAMGSAAAMWASTVIRSYLYKPPAYDWSAWTAAVILILVAALTGISIPAWKASRIEPVSALRQD